MWPVAVVPVGRVACATTLWRAKGRLHVTVVVKARFQLVHNGEMAPTVPEPVRPELGELAPYLTQADVVIAAAHAYPRSPTPAPALAVRLAVFREWAVIDKSLLVYPTDETGRRAHAVTGPIPVVVGPMGAAEQPGILVNPSEASRPGSLGPLAVHAPERMALLGDEQVPSARSGISEIPDMFPWSYFQVAPADQRTSFLRGDEWVVLDGMDRELPRLQSRLPRAISQVYVYPPGLTGGSSFPVHMEADQLSIDVDRRECSMLWRGSFPVANELSARSLILAAGVALPAAPVRWPDLPTLMTNPILRAHGLVHDIPGEMAPRRPLPPPRAAQPDAEDADSMAATRNMSREDAVALFAELEADAELEEAPASVRSAEVAELEMSSDGVLSVHTLSDSVLVEVMKLIGEEAEVQVTNDKGEKRRRTALGLPKAHPSRVLRPVGVGPSAAQADLGESSDDAPNLDEQSVDKLEMTLSDALTAQGIATIDELEWRKRYGGPASNE